MRLMDKRIVPLDKSKGIFSSKYKCRTIVCQYLDSGEPTSCKAFTFVDIFQGVEIHMERFSTFQKDGWAWDSEDLYYFEKYGMKLEEDFIRHVLNS